MAEVKQPAPSETLRDYFEFRDNDWYWRNIPENSKRDLINPVGYVKPGSKARYKNIKLPMSRDSLRASRIIHWLHTGEWPPIVDHKDRNSHNNHHSNLRSADTALNRINSGGMRTGAIDSSDVKADGSRVYRTRIRINKKNQTVGQFSDPIQAMWANLMMREILYPGITPDHPRLTNLKDVLKEALTERGY